jgi:hypothetical protein
MTNRFEQAGRERDALADSLAADYATDLPKRVADRAFALAWEHGHSMGEGEVETYYVDFADLAGDAYRAGRDSVRG